MQNKYSDRQFSRVTSCHPAGFPGVKGLTFWMMDRDFNKLGSGAQECSTVQPHLLRKNKWKAAPYGYFWTNTKMATPFSSRWRAGWTRFVPTNNCTALSVVIWVSYSKWFWSYDLRLVRSLREGGYPLFSTRVPTGWKVLFTKASKRLLHVQIGTTDNKSTRV